MKLILNNFENIVDRSRSFDNGDNVVNNDDNEDCVRNFENISRVFE